MRIFYLPLLVLLTACSTEEAGPPPPAPVTPNIIFILADDLGYGDLGCYGQEVIPTPNIDQLAKEGVRFTRFYAGSTVCAPSRVSLMTGKMPGRTSVWGNGAGQQIKDEETTLAELLSGAGYTSGVIGKWGMGSPQPPSDPARNGFDYAYGYSDMLHAHNFYPEYVIKNGEREPLAGNVSRTDIDWSSHYSRSQPMGGGVAKQKVTYTIDEFDREAAEFIRRNKDTTFFLYLTPNTPHANNEAGWYGEHGMEVATVKVEDEYVYDFGEFSDKDWPEAEKGFAKMITNLDRTVGMVREELVAAGVADNTIIMFTSDNGPHEEGKHALDFFDSNGPLRGSKRDLYEGGIRVPFIAHWPGYFPATTTDFPFAFWDVMPTLAELTNQPVPEQTDGLSFLPTLKSEAIEAQRTHEFMYWDFYEQGGKQAVLNQDGYKLVRLHWRDKKPEEFELYNVVNDIGEERDLIAEPELQELVAELKDYLAGQVAR